MSFIAPCELAYLTIVRTAILYSGSYRTVALHLRSGKWKYRWRGPKLFIVIDIQRYVTDYIIYIQ